MATDTLLPLGYLPSDKVYVPLTVTCSFIDGKISIHNDIVRNTMPLREIEIRLSCIVKGLQTLFSALELDLQMPPYTDALTMGLALSLQTGLNCSKFYFNMATNIASTLIQPWYKQFLPTISNISLEHFCTYFILCIDELIDVEIKRNTLENRLKEEFLIKVAHYCLDVLQLSKYYTHWRRVAKIAFDINIFDCFKGEYPLRINTVRDIPWSIRIALDGIQYFESSLFPQCEAQLSTLCTDDTEKNMYGTQACTQCLGCAYLNTSSSFYNNIDKQTYHSKQTITCNSKNVIFAVNCSLCDFYCLGATSNVVQTSVLSCVYTLAALKRPFNRAAIQIRHSRNYISGYDVNVNDMDFTFIKSPNKTILHHFKTHHKYDIPSITVFFLDKIDLSTNLEIAFNKWTAKLNKPHLTVPKKRKLNQ